MSDGLWGGVVIATLEKAAAEAEAEKDNFPKKSIPLYVFIKNRLTDKTD